MASSEMSKSTLGVRYFNSSRPNANKIHSSYKAVHWRVKVLCRGLSDLLVNKNQLGGTVVTLVIAKIVELLINILGGGEDKHLVDQKLLAFWVFLRWNVLAISGPPFINLTVKLCVNVLHKPNRTKTFRRSYKSFRNADFFIYFFLFVLTCVRWWMPIASIQCLVN